MAGRIQGPQRRIVLVGKTGSGKSAIGNTILGAEILEFGMSLNSITKTCQREETQWNGRKIEVVDTPGFFDPNVSESETAAEVKKCVGYCNPGPHVILQVVRLDRFSQEEKAVAEQISKIFSLKAKNYMIIVFTRKDNLEGKTLEKFLSEGDEVFQRQLAQCGHRYLSFNNRAKGEEREAQVAQLMKMIDELVKKNKHAPCYTEEMLNADKKVLPWCSIL